MKSVICILCLILLFPVPVSCQDAEPKVEPVILTEKKMTYLALGDSYTIGESVPESDRFPVLLAGLLNNAGYTFEKPEIIAKTGWTTDELKAGIAAGKVQPVYTLVTLLIGVNNQYRGRDPEEYRLQFRELLETAIYLAGYKTKNVIVVSIPDWGVSPFAKDRDGNKIAAEIDRFNSIKKEETLKKNVLFVNITPTTRMARDKPEYFAFDGLHFSGKMNQLWAEEIAKAGFKLP